MVAWLIGWTVLYGMVARCAAMTHGMVAGRGWWLIGSVEEPGEPRIDGDLGRPGLVWRTLAAGGEVTRVPWCGGVVCRGGLGGGRAVKL